MRMFKGLMLSTASVLAVVGAQAADLPVKAKPVEYVKICSLYGDGFYYIPGTDICLKLGGYIRADYGYNVSGGRRPLYFGANGRHTRESNEFSTRHRFNINIDTRSQTAYGTLRTFGSFNVQNEDEADTAQAVRAFIQWAGFTFGRTQSFTDSITLDEIGALIQGQGDSDSGATGTNQIAYTWELGNGMTLSVGADERRARSIQNFSTTTFSAGADPASSRGGNFVPDPWIAFKVSQAWGRFSIAGVGHLNNATYYTAAPGIAGYVPGVSCAAQAGTTFCDHPGDEWGFAVLAGGEFKMPFIAPKDSLYWFANYGQGAVRYSGGINLTSPGLFGSGNKVAVGLVTDAVYVNGSSLELTTAWSVGGGYVHWWTNQFSTAIYGAHTRVEYNDTVVNNAWFCGSNGGINQNVRVPSGTSCDPSFALSQVGIVQNWYPAAGFRLAVDVGYTFIDTAFNGPVSLNGGIGTRPTGGYTAKDLGTLAVVFRAQRTFPP